MAFLDFLVNNTVPTQSGINWGHSTGHVCEFDAYLPIRVDVILNNPGLIPPLGTNLIFDITWDDGRVMPMQFEGNNNNGFPKQLASYPDKSTLGHYLRNRMGINTSRLITNNDFTNYGTHGVHLTLDPTTGKYLCTF